MGIRRWVGTGLASALVGALLAAPVGVVTAPASAAVRTGTIVVTIKTPAGVPGRVLLKSNGRTKVASKAAAGTSARVRLRVPVGRWRVVPQRIATSTALYGGTASKSVVRVLAGRTSAVTVTYRKLTSVGTLALTINTPAGVPATVKLQSGAQSRLATKAPEGTSALVRLPVPAGTWQVQPQEIVDDSALYRGVASRSAVTVPPGGSASATVTYTEAPSVTDLHVVALEATSIQLGWTEPSAGASYVVRRATGPTAPATMGGGTPVGVDGTTATDNDVTAGATFSYSVFAQEAGSSTWVGPVSTTVTAPATAVTGQSAAVMTNPSTVMVTDGASITTTVLTGQVRTTVPAGTVPSVGQPWVLPPEPGLPTGYLGKVVSVSSDGLSVVLRPAGLADAFDYLDINVPSFDAAQVQVTSAQSRTAAGLISCSTGGDTDFDIDRDLDPYGDLEAHLRKKRALGVNWPIGASFEGEFGVKATLGATASIDGSATCELNLPKITIWFMAGPVPMAFTAQPTGSASVSGHVIQRVGVIATLGAEFEGYFGLGGEDYIDGSLVTDVDPYADVDVAGDMSLNIGAEIELGIGTANPKAGALVGAKGTFTALDAHATPVLGNGTCLEVSAQRSVSVQLEAKAWLGDHTIEKTLDVPFLSASEPWGGSPWTYPNTCAPSEYRIASGTVNVSSDWSGGCNSDQGWCEWDYGTSTYEFDEDSNATLHVAPQGGEWVPRFDSSAEAFDRLTAPMHFVGGGWNYSYHEEWFSSSDGCSSTSRTDTVGGVEFGGAYWESAVATSPRADQGLAVELDDYYWWWGEEGPPVGEWTSNWFHGYLGAWDTDYSNEFPRIAMRNSWSWTGCGDSGSETGDPWFHNIEWLGQGYWNSPEETRMNAAPEPTVTPLEGCTPEACRWQVSGQRTYDYRANATTWGYGGSGSTTVNWSFVIESRATSEETAPEG